MNKDKLTIAEIQEIRKRKMYRLEPINPFRCGACGTKQLANSKFCIECGVSL